MSFIPILRVRLAHAAAWLRRITAPHPSALIGGVVAFSLLAWACAGWIVWFAADVTRGLPSAQIAGIGNMVQATTLFDATDRPVFAIFTEQRIEIPLAKVSPNLVNAVIALEDQRFYEHRGIDAVRMIAATLANVRQGRFAQGGSTITQQLARQSLLTLDKTMRRKFTELVLAAQIERMYTKPQILELYLNKVYFGDGFHGVEAASLGFFGKHASELDVAEAAMLAGLVKSPSTYAPTVNMARAIARRETVLQAMLDAHVIDAAAYARAHVEPVKLENLLRRDEAFGLYFKEQVRLELIERFGWDRVYEGGLRVFTTIDPALQKAAEDLTEAALVEIEKRPRYPHPIRASVHVAPSAGEQAKSEYLQAALLAMDPANGHVRALLGGRNFWESRFNRASQAKRQPGSAFKPFVFATALEAGFTPASLIEHLNDPIDTAQGAWVPEDEHSDADAMTLRTALRTSSNRAAVQLLQQVGIAKTVRYAENMSIGTLPSVPSLALGAGEVTLQSMTAAYGAFANGGFVRKPVLIRRVEDEHGTVLFTEAPQADRVVNEATAFMMASMLADVINAGTGNRARREGFTLPAAGKTGTTNDYVDAWFVGFTPHLVTGVWVGFDQPKTIVRGGYAAELAVPLWARFMKVATRHDKPDWLRQPANVVGIDVCRLSGKLPEEGCFNVEVMDDDGRVQTRSYVSTEYFLRGTEPQESCDLHRPTSIYDQIAGTVRVGEEPPVMHGGAEALPPAPVYDPSGGRIEPTTGGVLTDQQRQTEKTPEKKRGFWSRIFGRGDKDKDTEKDKAPKQGVAPPVTAKPADRTDKSTVASPPVTPPAVVQAETPAPPAPSDPPKEPAATTEGQTATTTPPAKAPDDKKPEAVQATPVAPGWQAVAMQGQGEKKTGAKKPPRQ